LARRPVPVSRPVEAQPKRKILQRWCGWVERVEGDRFRAVVEDETTPSNPREAVQFDVRDVSEYDRSLLAEGAVFYWSIGYRDSVAGQRERFSTLRFARRPHITDAYLNRIRREAAELAALLSDD
jgi:hypothetical protein